VNSRAEMVAEALKTGLLTAADLNRPTHSTTG
jgi:hypothetical protein